MKIIEDQTFDAERALYGSRDIMVKDCSFDGPAGPLSGIPIISQLRIRSFTGSRRWGSARTPLSAAAIFFLRSSAGHPERLKWKTAMPKANILWCAPLGCVLPMCGWKANTPSSTSRIPCLRTAPLIRKTRSGMRKMLSYETAQWRPMPLALAHKQIASMPVGDGCVPAATFLKKNF